MLPGVAVPAFPERIEQLPTWFLGEIVPTYFGRYVITAEDSAKTEMYRANEVRRTLAVKLDLDTFLAELQIDCTLVVDSAERVARAAQMTQKTNQFNVTTRRDEIPDITRFVASSEHAVVMLEYRDRFASEGAVGLAILDFADGRIDSFLMSCRVLGRKVEQRLLAKCLELFRERGIEKIIGEYIPTRKNQLAATFYEDHGFALTTELPDGRKLYERPTS